MKIKRILELGLALTIAASIAGCTNSETQQASDDAVKKIAIIQLIDNGAFTQMREGLKTEIEESGIAVEFEELNAQGDATTLQTYVQNAISKNVDMIATIATPATQATVAAQTDIPNVFVAVSDPVTSQILTTMEAPDKNATGTQNPIPVKKIFETSKKLTPDVKTYGIIYAESETNAVSTANQAKEYLDSVGIEYTEKTVANSADIQMAVGMLLEKCDALFIPNSAIIQDAMPVIMDAANRMKKPVYGSSAVMSESGALASVAISDFEIGRISGEMAVEILNGKAVCEVPAKAVEATVTTVNKATAQTLGITIPSDMEIVYTGE